MPLGLGGVVGLLQAAQQPVVDGVLLRLAGDLGEDALELESALRVLDVEAQAAGEFGELVELERLGGGVRRRRNRISWADSVPATASLAASMNSSITWWLWSLTARWAPLTTPSWSRSISTSGRFNSSARG